MRLYCCRRRGLAVSEYFVVLGLLAIAILAVVRFMGDTTAQKINDDLNGNDGLLGRQAAAATGYAATGNK
jgi:hypothetical protein